MTTYNGWTNYETWNVKLWLDNDSYFYDSVRAYVAAQDGLGSESMADDLKHYVWDLFGGDATDTTGPFSDLLTNAWAKVNWTEVRDAYVEELSEAS